ncbi:Crp/Fnr family transcriptional regulator [Sphaerisporangium sp. NPDC004334]
MANLEPDIRDELLALAPPAIRKRGQVLIRQGAHDRHVFLLRSAAGGHGVLAKVTADLANGEQTLLGVRVSGDLVGEMASLRGLARSATVTLCSDSFVHVISDEVFTAFLHAHPAAWHAVTQMVADRLDWANRRRADMAGLDVVGRLVHVLIELAAQHGHPVEEGFDLGVPLTQPELGRLIGAKEDAVGKAMRHLARLRLTRTRYGRVIILDLDRLRRHC